MTTEAKTQAISRVDPQVLLQRAVENNASIETLERLVALAKDVREVQAKEAWHHAMAEFQRRVPPITKSSTAVVTTMRGQYKYSYAQLGDILEIIRPILGELGLTITWETSMEQNRVVVSCRVSHELGHSESSGKVSMPVPDDADRGGGNPSQRVGSSLTYARKYSLLCVTGLCPEDDDDARATDPKRPVAPQKPESPAAHSGTVKGGIPDTQPEGLDSVPSPAGDTPSPLDALWVKVKELCESKGLKSDYPVAWARKTYKAGWRELSEEQVQVLIMHLQTI